MGPRIFLVSSRQFILDVNKQDILDKVFLNVGSFNEIHTHTHTDTHTHTHTHTHTNTLIDFLFHPIQNIKVHSQTPYMHTHTHRHTHTHTHTEELWTHQGETHHNSE